MSLRVIFIISILVNISFFSKADFILINNDPMMPVSAWQVWKDPAQAVLLSKHIDSGGGMSLISIPKNQKMDHSYLWIVQNYGVSGGSVFSMPEENDCLYVNSELKCIADSCLESVAFGSIIKKANQSWCKSVAPFVTKVQDMAYKVRVSYAKEGVPFNLPYSPLDGSYQTINPNYSSIDQVYTGAATTEKALLEQLVSTKRMTMRAIDFSNYNGKAKPSIAKFVNENGGNVNKTFFIDCKFDNADLEGLVLDGITFENCSFKGANLAGAYVRNTTFYASEVSGIKNVDFTGANLKGAKFVGATIEKADFSNAQVSKTDFTAATLRESNLSQVDLEEIILNNTNLDGSNFEGVDLRQSKWKRTGKKFIIVKIYYNNKTNFSNTNLKNTRWDGSIVKGMNFSGANFTGAKFYDNYFAGANLSNAVLATNLSGFESSNGRTYSTKVSFSGSNMQGANFEGATVGSIQRANLSGANMRGITLNGFLYKVNLKGTDLSGATLTGANFSNDDMSGAHLDGANLQYASMGKTNLSGATIKNANLKLATLSGANLTKTHLDNSNLSQSWIGGADFTGAAMNYSTNLKNAIYDEKTKWIDGKPIPKSIIRKYKMETLSAWKRQNPPPEVDY
ncbi:pentapeptide repeat-containing protein [bacterium]|jgi:uncharacterized protein YjbI with pentapeptide repeats|nr:pentapeptide repeat-containing protein [bacterium]